MPKTPFKLPSLIPQRSGIFAAIACIFSIVLLAPVAAAEPLQQAPYGTLADLPPHNPERAKLKAAYQLFAKEEAEKAGVPTDLVDAVIKVESDYDASRIGAVGEIGLMQVRPGTAAMLGLKGLNSELADPAINIHYGATYLGQAWHLTHGDVCRTLMKYRAGHGEETMSALSQLYCSRARAHLAASGSPLAAAIAAPMLVGPEIDAGNRAVATKTIRRPRHGPAFWLAEEMRIRILTERVRARWRKIASR